MLNNQELIFEDKLLQRHLECIAGDQALGYFGLQNFDELVGGIRSGRLITIIGAPAVSKTTFMAQLIDSAAEAGFTCLVGTLEVPAFQLVAKSISRCSNGALGVADVPTNLSSEAAKASIAHYEQSIAPNICYVDDACNAERLGELVEQAKKERGGGVVLFVDYIQRMPPERECEEAEERKMIQAAMRGLRDIAIRHDTMVIAISTMTRTSYGKDVAGLDSPSGSNSIEYEADIVLHMSVDGDEKQRAKNMALPNRPITITAIKNRYGRSGGVKLVLDCEHATFRERK